MKSERKNSSEDARAYFEEYSLPENLPSFNNLIDSTIGLIVERLPEEDILRRKLQHLLRLKTRITENGFFESYQEAYGDIDLLKLLYKDVREDPQSQLLIENLKAILQ